MTRIMSSPAQKIFILAFICGIISSSQSQSIRIYSDFSALEPQSLTEEQVNYIEYFLVPAATSYIQQAINVTVPSSDYITVSSCAGTIIPYDIQLLGKNNVDIIILFTAINSPTESRLAIASNCLFDTTANRPTAALIQINQAQLCLGTINHVECVQKYWNQHLKAFIQAFFVALGFDQNLFAKFTGVTIAQSVTTPDGASTQEIILPSVVREAKSHFDCSSIQGVPLDPQSYANGVAYWYRRNMGNDVMTIDVLNQDDVRISNITLAFFEGVASYAVNYSYGEPLQWGYKKGCNFLSDKCILAGAAQFEEFCVNHNALGNNSGWACSANKLSVGACQSTGAASTPIGSYADYFGTGTTAIDSYSANCLYARPQDAGYSCASSTWQNNGFENIGTQSACFQGTLSQTVGTPGASSAYCLSYSCVWDSASSTYSLTVTMGSTTASCTSEGSISVTGFGGNLDCPDPAQYCELVSRNQYCPFGCGGHGTCVDNVCVCSDDYTGPGCTIPPITDNYPDCVCNYPRTSLVGSTCICPSNDCSSLSSPTQAQCAACRSNCLACTTVSNCTSCPSKYFVTAQGSCIPCNVAGCMTCPDNLCTACLPGYSYANNSGDITCTSVCPANCIDCTSSTDCNACSNKYYLSSDHSSCLPCSDQQTCLVCESATVCTTCITGYYAQSTTGTCLQCPTGCSTCSSATNCLTCSDSYQLNTTDPSNIPCSPVCPDNCKLCSNPNTCATCVDGYYWDVPSTQCTLCPNNCLTCTDSSDCLTCVDGTYLETLWDSTKRCANCSANCLTCQKLAAGSTNTLNCTQCATGFTLSAGACFQNAAQKTCSDYEYFYDGSCEPCAQGCKECSDDRDCTRSSDTYYLQLTQRVVQIDSVTTSVALNTYAMMPHRCPVPGKTCLNSTYMLSCEFNYTLTNGQCNKTCNEGCLPGKCYDTGICTQCNDTWGWWNNTCKKCPDNCQICEVRVNSTETVCIQCESNYEVVNGLCQDTFDITEALGPVASFIVGVALIGSIFYVIRAQGWCGCRKKVQKQPSLSIANDENLRISIATGQSPNPVIDRTSYSPEDLKKESPEELGDPSKKNASIAERKQGKLINLELSNRDKGRSSLNQSKQPDNDSSLNKSGGQGDRMRLSIKSLDKDKNLSINKSKLQDIDTSIQRQQMNKSVDKSREGHSGDQSKVSDISVQEGGFSNLNLSYSRHNPESSFDIPNLDSNKTENYLKVIVAQPNK